MSISSGVSSIVLGKMVDKVMGNVACVQIDIARLQQKFLDEERSYGGAMYSQGKSLVIETKISSVYQTLIAGAVILTALAGGAAGVYFAQEAFSDYAMAAANGGSSLGSFAQSGIGVIQGETANTISKDHAAVNTYNKGSKTLTDSLGSSSKALASIGGGLNSAFASNTQSVMIYRGIRG